MKSKILVITDSLGLPREHPEKVEYNETWVSLLKSKFEVHQFSLGGGTINEMFSQLAYLKMFKPDFVIVQAGIVDSAPRALSKKELLFIKKSRWLSRFFKRKKVLKFLRKFRGLTYTNRVDFLFFIKKIKEEFGENLYWIEILPPSSEYEKNLPGIKQNVLDYNKLINTELKKNIFYTKTISNSYLMSDMIHLNTKGHNKLFRIIEGKLLNKNKD